MRCRSNSHNRHNMVLSGLYSVWSFALATTSFSRHSGTIHRSEPSDSAITEVDLYCSCFCIFLYFSSKNNLGHKLYMEVQRATILPMYYPQTTRAPLGNYGPESLFQHEDVLDD